MPTPQRSLKLSSEKVNLSAPPTASPEAQRCRKKFLKFFPRGFRDEKYIHWERGYKWTAHEQWKTALNRRAFRAALSEERFADICAAAVRIESRTNLLFSFEKMALRDAVKPPEGARKFAEELFEFLYGRAKPETRFNRWCDALASLPRPKRRVLTHPVATVFGFLAEPETHIFLKPQVTREAARQYGFDFHYNSTPSWETYAGFLEFAETVRRDLADLAPRDMIDIQSFMWVQGSSEYA